jgi:thiamine monophosphate synthase
LEYARQAAAEISIPCVAIAGITIENAAEVFAGGVQAIAVTAAVAGCQDVQGAARRLKAAAGVEIRASGGGVGLVETNPV